MAGYGRRAEMPPLWAISVLAATLFVVLALNRSYLARLGSRQIFRLALIWGVIIAAAVLLVRMAGF